MKILYIITSTNAGGTEKALLELIRRIDRDEYEVYVCSLKRPGVFAKRIEEAADGFYSLGLAEAGGIKAVLTFLPALVRLIRLSRRVRPMIIHSFLFRANILGRFAARVAGVPIVISSIRVIESDKHYKHIIDRLTSSMVNRYMAVSEAARKFTIKHVRVCPDKIVTVYNGIDCSAVLQGNSNGFTINKALINIALIGRFDRQKGHVTLIKAVKTISARHPDIRVYFFGEGPDEIRIKTIVKQERLSEYIIFVGVTEEISRCIAQMDIIVLPSLWEGLPNVLLEAMAEARPVVASRIEGIDEVVLDGKTGILFKPGDARALAQALLRLIEDRQLAEEMGMAGKKRVLEQFPLEKTVKETEAVYRSLIMMEKSD